MTDHTLDASVIVDLNGNLRQNAAQYQNALGAMSRNGSKHLSVLQRTTARLDRTMNRLGNRWVALASGGAMVAAGKKVLDFDATLTRMQTGARLTDEQADKLKNTLQSVANQRDIRIPIDDLTGAVAQFLDKTGDVEYAIDNIRNFGLMMQGLGVESKSAGELMAQFWEDQIESPQAVTGVMDRLFAQFSRGSVPVKDIADVSAELFSTVLSRGPKAITDIGALAQVFAKTAGNANKAQTALVGTVRALDSAQAAPKIDRALVSRGLAPIREASGLIRPLPQLLLDITKVANNSVPVLSTIFDTEAMNGLKSLLNPTNKQLLMEMVDGAIEQNLTLNSSAKNAATARAALDSLANAGRRFADLNLSEPIQDLADTINTLNDAQLVSAMETAKDLAIAIGAVIVGYKGMRLAKGLAESGKRLGKGPGGALGDVASMAAPIPVFVVNNLPGAAGGIGGGGKAKGGVAAPGKVGKIAKVGSLAMRTGGAGIGVAGAGALGYGLGSMINKMVEGSAFYDWVGATAARIMALGSDEAAEAVRLNGDKHSVYGGTGWANDEGKEATRVELELGAEASRLLNAKVVHKAGTDVDVSGSMGAR